jgi:hypothetical protein
MYNTNSTPDSQQITIRAASVLDRAELRRVAQRDSRPLPDGQLLLAEVNGEAHAAIALTTGEVIADPFRPTSALVRMLSVRRSQVRGEVRSSHSRVPSPALSARLS